jgi:hypothetical protein
VSEPYREPVLPRSDPYLLAWDQYRRRPKRLLLVFLSWPVATFLGAFLLSTLTGAPQKEVAPFVGIPVFLAAIALMHEFLRFDCPRCGKPFDARGLGRSAFTPRCANCGIEVGTPKGST